MSLCPDFFASFHCEASGATDFDRSFETLSIFDETSDMGVFEGAESNGDVSISSKLIFVVKSSFAGFGATTAPMTSICRQNIFQMRQSRVSSAGRIFHGTGVVRFRARESEGHDDFY